MARSSVVCRYRSNGKDRGDHRDEGWTVWTSNDPINGGLSPESHAVLLCLLEKKVHLSALLFMAAFCLSLHFHNEQVLCNHSVQLAYPTK